MSLIGLLVAILVICVVLWCARKIIAAFDVDEPIATVLFVLAVLVCLLILLQAFWGIPGLNVRIR